MVNSLDIAFKRAKQAIETLYRDKATVSIKSSKPTNKGFDDKTDWTPLMVDVPCKVSRRAQKSAADAEYAGVNQEVVIYLDTAIQVPAGARIDVVDVNGQRTKYKRANGGYMSYATHQEVVVVLDERK